MLCPPEVSCVRCKPDRDRAETPEQSRHGSAIDAGAQFSEGAPLRDEGAAGGASGGVPGHPGG